MEVLQQTAQIFFSVTSNHKNRFFWQRFNSHKNHNTVIKFLMKSIPFA